MYYNQHTRGMATNRHRSLVERSGRKAFEERLLLETKTLHTKIKEGKNICQKKTDIHEFKGKDLST